MRKCLPELKKIKIFNYNILSNINIDKIVKNNKKFHHPPLSSDGY